MRDLPLPRTVEPMVNPTSTDHDRPLDSLSGKLGPVYVKELRQGLRARLFTVPFLSIHALAILIVASQFLIKHFTDPMGTTPSLGAALFSTSVHDHALLLMLWLLIGIVMPLTGINALQSELVGGRNVELLLMAGLTRWQITRGKWLVLCTLSALIMISILPYMLTLYFTGGVDLIAQLTNFIGLSTFNIYISAVIIGSSGFRPLLGRLIAIGLTFFSWLFTSMIVLGPLSISSTSLGPLEWSYILPSYLLITSVYVVYGLQLGRARLRLYEDPVDPPATGLIIALIIFTPVITGIFRAASGPIGTLLVLAGLLALGLMIDRDPSEEGHDNLAQP